MFPDGKPVETLQLLSLTQGHQNLINSYLQLILQFYESQTIAWQNMYPQICSCVPEVASKSAAIIVNQNMTLKMKMKGNDNKDYEFVQSILTYMTIICLQKCLSQMFLLLKCYVFTYTYTWQNFHLRLLCLVNNCVESIYKMQKS